MVLILQFILYKWELYYYYKTLHITILQKVSITRTVFISTKFSFESLLKTTNCLQNL